MAPKYLRLTTLFSFFYLFPNIAGYIQQIIVDDTDSTIQYSPHGWNRGNLCAICSEGLDLNQIYGKTWNNGSTLRGSGDTPVFFSFPFTGIYLDIVFIAQAVPPISKSTEGVLSDANVTITIDRESISYSQQLVQGSDTNQLVGYNKSLYSQGWTTNSKHYVRVDLAPLGSTFSLDYIAYSVEVAGDEPSPTAGIEMTSRDALDRGKVIAIGAATGGSALVALAAFFAWWYVRRKRVAQRNTLEPFGQIIGIAPSGPAPAAPTSRSREEKVPFPSTPSPATATPSTTMARQYRALTRSLSLQPLLPLSNTTTTPPGASPQSSASHVQGFHLNNFQATPTTANELGDLDMDVPPPAYSPTPPHSSIK